MFCCSRNNLNNIDENELEYFSFDGLTFTAKTCNIYDGDTFTAIFIHNNTPIKYRCRCLGYDSPEIKPLKSIENRNEIIEKANISKNKFIELLQKHPTKQVTIHCHKFDKYGRILVEVFNNVDKQSINEIMLNEGYGVHYDGGKKNI